jgi:ABC-2 type transport system ATP-binding protein
MLELHSITKSFNSDLFRKEFVAVNNLSFKIEEGKITGFLGANGAGKTTTMKMMMDFIRPTSGEISFISTLGAKKSEILKNIGFLPERPYFYPNLSGREFCYYMGQLSGVSIDEIKRQVEYWAPVFKIDFALDRAIRNYSKGMLQRVGFLVTLLHDPKLIILDEPLSGLDPIGRKELKDVIVSINRLGKTVFFSSHIISDVEEVCHDVTFIKDGSLFYQGSVEKIINEHARGESLITFIKNESFETVKVKDEDKNDALKKLINDGFKIVKVETGRVTLEEIIYNVK